MTTKEYLYNTEETNRLRELAAGVVREPPAPFFSHQLVVLKVARIISDHVEPRGLGRVAIAPVDVVLDADRALILQPDILFIATLRLSIVRRQVWGAPDLVVEVTSPGTEARDRTEKRDWYRQYGVREYWIVDPQREEVAVNDFTLAAPTARLARESDVISSTVLPELHTSAFEIFS